MKFTADKESFRNVVAVAQEVIANTNTASISAYIRLEVIDGRLDVRAFDPGVRFSTSIPIEDGENGTALVFCAKLFGIINSLPDAPVSFTKDEGSLDSIVRPEGKRITFRLKTMTSEKFPMFKSPNQEWTELSAENFIDGTNSVAASASDDITRLMMTGVYIEPEDCNINFVATDGKRLSFFRMPSKASFKPVIVPPKVIRLIGKYGMKEGSLSLAVGDTEISVKTGDYVFSSSVIDTQYPAYRRVIPSSQDNTVTVSRDDIMKALKRIRLMTEKKTGRVILGISKDKIIFSGQTDDGCVTEEIDAKCDGENMDIALNISYMMDAVDSLKSDSVALMFTEEMKPVTVKNESEENFFHIIMPMQKK